MDSTPLRMQVLNSFGAPRDAVLEMLRYSENSFKDCGTELSDFPLSDEPFVQFWRQYAEEVAATGTIHCLSRYLVQLAFPIQKGISQTHDYILATRQGAPRDRMSLATGISLQTPSEDRLIIHQTSAGSIPTLIAGSRTDFVALLQAFMYRNEPEPISRAMGACIIAGYNNWHRISLLKAGFFESGRSPAEWPQEFSKIRDTKEFYQDRFIILSTGPYSGVPSRVLGLDEEEWLALSMIIRREHECAHYFTRRVFSSMHNNLLDEIIADYCGIRAAVGRFRADWFLEFMGLKDHGGYRSGARLENYRGRPPLSDPAFTLLQRLVISAAHNLEQFDYNVGPAGNDALRPALMRLLTACTLEELASTDAPRAMTVKFAVLRGSQKSSHRQSSFREPRPASLS